MRSPLAELGFSKADIRALSRRAGLETWDVPAQPCLSSRIAHFTPVTVAKLREVEQAEAAVRALGFSEFRVRHHGPLARLEVAAIELRRALEPRTSALIGEAIRSAGFKEVVVDSEPFRSGRLSRESAPSSELGAEAAS